MAVHDSAIRRLSLKNLINSAISDFSSLLTYHVDLVKAEVKEDATSGMKVIALMVGALLAVYTAFIFLGVFFILVFGLIMPIWMSALLVMILYGAFAVLSVILIKYTLEKMREGNESVARQILKTLEVAKKWLRN